MHAHNRLAVGVEAEEFATRLGRLAPVAHRRGYGRMVLIQLPRMLLEQTHLMREAISMQSATSTNR